VPTHTTAQIPTTIKTPKSLHLDKRVDQIIAQNSGRPDELLSDQSLARWLGVSNQWPHQARIGGYGPPYLVIGPRRIRYRRDQVNAWLSSRQVRSTAETPERSPANRGKRRADGYPVGGRPPSNGADSGAASGAAMPSAPPGKVGFKRGN
jgi:hypothetical protein